MPRKRCACWKLESERFCVVVEMGRKLFLFSLQRSRLIDRWILDYLRTMQGEKSDNEHAPSFSTETMFHFFCDRKNSLQSQQKCLHIDQEQKSHLQSRRPQTKLMILNTGAGGLPNKQFPPRFSFLIDCHGAPS